MAISTARHSIEIGEESPRRWKLGLVRAANLKIDPSYHDPRRLNEQRAQRIAENFDLDKVGTVTVSERDDGSQWTIDGQHRIAAARIAGVEFLPARIFQGITVSEEAGIFWGLSDYVRLRPEFQWRARIVAGERLAVAITETLDTYGMRIAYGGSNPDPRTTRAITAIEALHESGLLAATLKIIQATWPEDTHALDGPVLWGVGSFLSVYQDHPRFSRSRLGAKLGELPASAVIRLGKDLRGSMVGRFGTGGGGAGGGGALGLLGHTIDRRAVLQIYNRHLRNGLPDTTLSDLKGLGLGENPWLSND